MTDQLYCPACGPDWHGAYDMNHRCAECGVALRAEKVMEKLKAMEEERDALARDLEEERYHRQAIERSDHALAAHVERISGLAHPVVGLCQACLEEDDDVEALLEALEEEPVTSLASLKAEWQAEALEMAADDDDDPMTQGWLRERARMLRYQSEA